MPTNITDDAWDWLDPDKQDDEEEQYDEYEPEEDDDRETGGENEGD